MQHDPIRITTPRHVADSDEVRNRRLLCAVVTRAVVDYVTLKGSEKPRDKRKSDEALDWVSSDTDCFDECGITFIAACDALGLSVTAVRATLQKLSKKDMERFRHVLSHNMNVPEQVDDDDS